MSITVCVCVGVGEENRHCKNKGKLREVISVLPNYIFPEVQQIQEVGEVFSLLV